MKNRKREMNPTNLKMHLQEFTPLLKDQKECSLAMLVKMLPRLDKSNSTVAVYKYFKITKSPPTVSAINANSKKL